MNVWLQSRSLPARGRVGLEVHRCLCIIDAFRNFDPADWGRVKWFYFCERQFAPSHRWAAKGVMRAIASSMSPHASPQQGPTPIFSAATADGVTTVQAVSAAATTLPTNPARDAASVKDYCTDRAIFTLLRRTTDELLFSCCGSVAASLQACCRTSA